MAESMRVLRRPNYHPLKIWLPLQKMGELRYWQALEPATVTLPEWIEGQARGTMKRENGMIYKLTVVSKEPDESSP